jgi:hypothetical protein
MRSLLIKASIITSLVLSLGSGITLASASSKPGMFLYPVKQTTQKAIGTFANIAAVEIPIAVPSQTPDTQETVVPENSSVKEIRPDTTQEPGDIEGISLDDTQGNEAANSASRTPVAPPQTPQMMDGEGQHSATDMIDPSALTSSQNSSDPSGNQSADSPDNHSQDNGSPGGNNPDNSQDHSNSHDNSQDNSSNYNESQDGSNYSDNSQDNNTSDSSQDNSSHDNSQDNANPDNGRSHATNQDNSNSHDNQNHDEHGSD